MVKHRRSKRGVRPGLCALRSAAGLCLLLLFTETGLVHASSFRAERLRCEDRTQPQAVENPRPRLSWVIVPATAGPSPRGVRQVACQVLVASTPELLARNVGDTWDSGREETAESIGFRYGGRELRPGEECWWKVRVWTVSEGEGSPSVGPWSKPGFWRNSLGESIGDQQWIGVAEEEGSGAVAHMLRQFSVEQPVRKATLAVAIVGTGTVWINGQQIGDAVLAPALTDVRRQVPYQMLDVTSRIFVGHNVIGVRIGPGRVGRGTTGAAGRQMMTWVRLEVEHRDGTKSLVTSDDAWIGTRRGPWIIADEFRGEVYDFGQEHGDWSTVGYPVENWLPVNLFEPPGGILVGQPLGPMRVVEEITAQTVKRTEDGRMIFDLGRSVLGVPRLRIPSGSATEILLRPVSDDPEIKRPAKKDGSDPNGVILLLNARSEHARIYKPEFALFGFRYVEATGLPETIDRFALTACLIRDDIGKLGTFESSDKRLNQVHDLIVSTAAANLRSIPTRSPEGHGREGWVGIRGGFARQESMIYDTAALYKKWMHDIIDTMDNEGAISDIAPAFSDWRSEDVIAGSALITLPGVISRYHGDTAALGKFYPAMFRWIAWQCTRLTEEGLHPGEWTRDTGYPLGMTAPEGEPQESALAGSLLSSLRLHQLLGEMLTFCQILGQEEDEERLLAWQERLKKGIESRYWDEERGTYGAQRGSAAAALLSELPLSSRRERVVHYLIQRVENDPTARVGAFGAANLLRGVTLAGRPDLAASIVLNEEAPGWAFMRAQGATALWERWGGAQDHGENSSLTLAGDVIAWLYEHLAGIRPAVDGRGFKRIQLMPSLPPQIDWVRAGHLSPHGWVRSGWKRTGELVEFDIEIPLNATAEIYIPSQNGRRVLESGREVSSRPSVRLLASSDREHVYETGSGRYLFSTELPPDTP